jgi:hypothetical protein
VSHQLNLSLVKASKDTQTVERTMLDVLCPEPEEDCLPLHVLKSAIAEIRQWVSQKKGLKGTSGRLFSKLQNLEAGIEHLRRTKGYSDRTKEMGAKKYLKDQLKGNGQKDGCLQPELYLPQTAGV